MTDAEETVEPMEAFPDLESLSDHELKGLIEAKVEEERQVSLQRRIVHGQLDLLRRERVGRLRDATARTSTCPPRADPGGVEELLAATGAAPRGPRGRRPGRRPPALAGGRGRARRRARLARGAGGVDGEPPTPDTQYRIGSISKTFTALLVLRLRDEGRLRLDDPLERHVPGTPFGERTVGQLLGHGAGLRPRRPGPGGSAWRAAPGPRSSARWRRARRRAPRPALPLLEPRLRRPRPGGRAQLRPALVRLPARPGAAAARAAPHDRGAEPPRARGLAVHPWAAALLPEPEHDTGAMAPAGQLWSTLADLGRLAALLLGDGGDVLSAESIEEMAVPGLVDSLAPVPQALRPRPAADRGGRPHAGRARGRHARLRGERAGRPRGRPGRRLARQLDLRRRLGARSRPARDRARVRAAAGRGVASPRRCRRCARSSCSASGSSAPTPGRCAPARRAPGAGGAAARRPRHALPARRRRVARPGRLLRRASGCAGPGPALARRGQLLLHAHALRPGRAGARRRRRGGWTGEP